MKLKMQLILSLIVFGLSLLGLLGYVHFTYRYLSNRFITQISHENEAAGNAFIKYLNDLKMSEASKENRVDLLQNFCGQVELHNNGFVYATDKEGNLLAISKVSPGYQHRIHDGYFSGFSDKRKDGFKDIAAGDKPFSGFYYQDGNADIVTMIPIEKTGMFLFIHQSLVAISKNIKYFVFPLLLIGTGISVVLGFVTYVIASLVIKRYEHRLEKVNRSLDHKNSMLIKVSEERSLYYQGLFFFKSAIALTDVEGKIVYVNPAFERLYGILQGEAQGKNPNILNPGRKAYLDLGISGRDYDRLFKDLWTCIANPQIGFWEGDLPNKAKDGSIIWTRLMINAIRNDEGVITHYIGFSINTTESRKLEIEVRMEIYRTITDLAEMRDNETGKHIIRVSKYTRKIAARMGLPRKFCEDIEPYASLHDIGKVGIPDGILLSSSGLTSEQRAIMMKHTTLGYNIMRGKQSMNMAACIVYMHHEKYDGTGYPQGLTGEDITQRKDRCSRGRLQRAQKQTPLQRWMVS